ncbi:hypothetical protein COV82_03685 [Candidatus Peregrinibacteria bacterium CG11_big_fil_rev_8_21_14_0_20_46_8]|nr:MAG: hypothetical protein COV82_03685 [Candidatus Peregrinibacteria bacterium CG11_big_fil_rev_8_21_14_0_20_46_8]
MYELAKIIGETRYLLGLSNTDGACLEIYEWIDEQIGVSALPERIMQKIPVENASALPELVPIHWV